MKALQSLTAIMLLGALSVGFNVAVAKGRNHASDAGLGALKSSDGGQKSGGYRSDNGTGAAKNSTTTPGNIAGGNEHVRAPDNAAPTKQGDNSRGKTGSQNVDPAQLGKNQIGNRPDSGRHEPDLNTLHRGSADAGPGTPVIADGPGHKTNRPADTAKKTSTIFRPRMVREPQLPTGLGKIERNSVGAVVPHDAGPKLGLDPKVSARVNGVPAGAPGPSTIKTIPNAGSLPTATFRPGHNLTDPPQHGPIINGNSVGHSGSNVTSIGGPTKNIVGTLSGNSFKPKRP
jgi:hypothetical protein